MKKKIRLTENKLVSIILKLIKEDEIEKVYISPEEYIQYLKNNTRNFMNHSSSILYIILQPFRRKQRLF